MTASARTSSSIGKRIFFLSTLLSGVVILCLILLFLVVPKAINQDAVKSRIEATISKDLGGTLTYDRMELVLIPLPKIEFHNVKIAVPGTGRASIVSVKIYAKLLSLLRGRFNISSVNVDQPTFSLVLPDTRTKSIKRSAQKTPPTSGTIGSVITAAGQAMPDLSLKILQGGLSIMRDGQRVLALENLEAGFAFVQGPQNEKAHSNNNFHITGEIQAAINGTAVLPGPLKISIPRFDAYPSNIVVAQSRARLLDMDIKLSGSVKDYISAIPKLDIVFSGSIGHDAAAWISALAHLPDDLMIRSPLKFTDVRLRSTGASASSSESLTGTVMAQDNASISFSLLSRPENLTIEKLNVKDSESDALLRLTINKEELYLAFSGNVTGATLSRFIGRDRIPFKRISGDISAHIPRNRWYEIAAEGTLEGEGLVIPFPSGETLGIDRFFAQSSGRSVDLRPVVLSMGKDVLTVEGTAAMSPTGVDLDLDVSANRIDIASFQQLVKSKKKDSGRLTTPSSSAKRNLNVDGDLRLRADVVTLQSYTAKAVAMTISKEKDQIAARLEHASICGIELGGTLKTRNDEMEISLEPHAHGEKLADSIPCIFHEDLGITGDYDLEGRLTGHGPSAKLLQWLQGNVDFTARQGRFHNDKIVRSVIAYLNSTSILKGSHSSLLKEGVPYETVVLRGSFREGVVSLKEGTVNSKELYITSEGHINLDNESLALNVLVAPFTNLDRILGKIPVLKDIAGNSLVVVPVRVEGTYHKPEVKPLPASAVSTNVTKLMLNIVKAPVKIIEPVIPK